ncbi:hypothetical protein K4K54_010322 [Colletotrichum sp. SAR 10_86]|nr:hypothetical protein KHU50_009295 [Colletotrichum sp. SAR 10_65]KAI8218536.1 hypothetical protein K4K54_010322 [Colletotrichum sp. SAR 10_86]
MAPLQTDIYEFLGQQARWSSPEPFPTFFDDAVYFQDCDGESTSSPSSSKESRSSLTMLSASPPSQRSQRTPSETSSAATPDPPPGSSPRFEVLLDHPVRGSDEDLHGLRRFDDKLTTPQLDDEDLPRPSKLDIAGHAKPARSRFIPDVSKVNSVRDAGAFAGLTHKNDDIVKEILRSARPVFDAHVFKGQIFLDRSCTGASLPACLRNYTYKTVGTDTITHVGCTFSKSDPNPALLQDHQLEWTERSLSPEDFSTFEGGIECLIRAYVRLGYARQRPQFSLLEKVHIFKSAYKICRAQTLFFVQPNGKGVEELPLPAQAELRGVARAALESSERDILSELDRYLKTPKISDQDRPAVWAALWQLMFVYRDLLRNVRPWRNNAEALFNAVAVFYATLFRTKAALKSLEEVKSAWLPNDAQRHDLIGAFNHALSLRDTFYQSIVAGIASIDERLKILVVDPEMKVLNRRATTKKPAGAKPGAAHSHDGDEVMGGC